MRHHAFPRGLDRDALVSWYRAARARTRQIFGIVAPEAYYERPIALRHPFVFYEGHLPGFSVNTLIKLALKRRGVDERLETLFARGIDPESEAAVGDPAAGWPSRDEVQAFAAEADRIIEEALRDAELVDPAVPQLRGGEAALTIVEHELMHHETLAYMLHNLAYDKKRRPSTAPRPVTDAPALHGDRTVRIPRGVATLGAERDGAFGWDNEFPPVVMDVEAFEIDVYNVTNGEYLEFMHATGAAPPHFWTSVDGEWYWRGMFELVPLPHLWPVYVTHDEAEAYARWKGKRLPTEAEYHRAAYGTPGGGERVQPWGDEPADATRGNFDFTFFDPVPVGSYPAGASAWGVHDLAGNGWEWTSTLFEGFPGFEPMPSYPLYSSDFFDRAHYVIKGASPATARELVRRSFRNWFRPDYPHVYATFRCAR